MKRLGSSRYLIAGLLILIALIAAYLFWRNFPPHIVVMTTSAPGSAYEVLAQSYQLQFAQAGVELRLMPSTGAVENLKRLNDPRSGVSVGFVQGGLTSEKLSPDLVSLGTVFYEPVWFFTQGVDPGPKLEGLRGRKVAIGPEGSGTRAVTLELLARNGIDPQVAEFLPLTPAEAGERLLRGEISAAFMVSSWDTPIVRRLLEDPHIELQNFNRADAYVALYPFLTKVVLPAGVGNMADNRPPEDTYLLASKASLIVRKEVSPAIQDLLLEAATEIHSGPGVFQKSGQFPAPEQVDLPLSREARQFYKSGLPILQRYLPFQLAAIAGSLLVLVVPLIGVYPLFRFAPTLYAWSMRRRIFKLYGEVKLIEIEMEKRGKSQAELLARLDSLESRTIHMRVSFMYAQFLYHLRNHISMVRSRLENYR